MKCCNKTIKLEKGFSEEKGDYVYYICETCGKKGAGTNDQQAMKTFNESKGKTTQKPAKSYNTTVTTDPEYNTPPQSTDLAPINRKDLQSWASSNMFALMNQSAQFIEKPATKKMIEKNIRYLSGLSGKAWDKIWSTPEGQESISHALSEALYHAATLPEMGSIVPFGSTAEFIPSVECYEFALTVGENPPFVKDSLKIIAVHENDQRENESTDGNFQFKHEKGIPRGEIIAVVVMGILSHSKQNVGEIYDASRLLEKAKQHSPSYRQYIFDKEDFTRMKVEGKLTKDSSGREYYEKTIEYTKAGKPASFKKKIYEHDIINPYDGPDRPEMLRKSAGKSFFRPYMKTRNASAMAEEWQDDESLQDEVSREKAADNVLGDALKQFAGDGASIEIKDAEIIPEKDNENKTGGDKKDLNKNSTGDQDENDIKDL